MVWVEAIVLEGGFAEPGQFTIAPGQWGLAC